MLTPNPLTWADFDKVDIRTGTIVDAEDFPQARKPAYKLTIDFGELGTKRSSAQLTKLYRADELIGRQVVAVVNFPPKQIATFMSECLVLGAVSDDGTVTLLHTERPTKNGLRIA
ncbi:tRNA-binding protein [Spirosoma flavum]|uniref:tRNA-binding protein n=1 Tax=Spirosoma flavum TaxID=2048557 RepID=A0ABW6AFU2_9BACT